MDGGDVNAKKARDVGFENVRDPAIKCEIIKLTKCPEGATNFIFWYSKVDNGWGLTLKSMPKKTGKDSKFPSQHIWKATWFFQPADESRVEPRLAVADHCKGFVADIIEGDAQRIADIYYSYRGLSQNNS